MPDLNIVVCAPVAEIGGHKFDPATAPYAQYAQVKCPHCQQGMWLGSRGHHEVEMGRAQMMCLVCAVTKGLMGPNTPMQKLTDRDA